MTFIDDDFENELDDDGPQAHEDRMFRRWEHLLADTRSTAALIERALSLTDDEAMEYVRILEILQLRDTREVLEQACALCRSPHPDARSFGANILGRLGNHTFMRRAALLLRDSEVEAARLRGDALLERVESTFGEVQQFPKEVLAVLFPMLDGEEDIRVLRDVLCAVGEYQQFHPMVTEKIAALRSHPSSEVRFTVSTRLSIGIDNPTAQRALAELCDDEDDEVRELVTINLADFARFYENEDTGEIIRQALLRRLDDPHAEIRGTALHGLAERSEPRVVEALLREARRTERADTYPSALVVAGAALGDPRLYPLLLELQVHAWLAESDEDAVRLQDALAKCRPQ